MRKRIAVLVAQIDETTQKRFLTEFIKKAYEYDYDVCIFTMYQKYQETPLRDIGDSNIFELINYALFDAVLIMSDTILTPGITIPLQESVKAKFSGPVLVVDHESPIFDSVIMDHYTPFKKIVDHLLEVHDYKQIAFLGGKEGHPHSVQRLNAFLDSMKEHDRTVNQDWIYHGNYWYDSAENFVDILLQNREKLPEALVCANDIMAIGAAARLTENGIRVPEDVAVTGYDSIDAGRYSPHPLTSSEIPAAECGIYSMNWLHAAINGETIGEFKANEPIFIGGSCGCNYEIEMVPKKLRSAWRTQQSSRSMFSDFNHMLEDMMAQNNVQGFLSTVKDYIYQIKPFKTFYMCLNEGFNTPRSIEKAIRKGYADTMYQVFSSKCNEEIEEEISFDRSFPVTELIPALHEERSYPTTFIFNPLYFDDRCFGYTVLNYGEEIRMYDASFRIWMRNIMQGMEAFYRQGFMLSLVEKIKADQIRDSLTGLYNYDGYISNAKQLIKQKRNTDKIISILTIDIKGMQQLNEVYGRDAGERAIKAVARFLRNSTHEDEITCRMCNDEFLATILDDKEGHRSEEIISEIRSRVKEYKLSKDADYELQVHCEYLAEDIKYNAELDSLINQAITIKNYKKHNAMQRTVVEKKDLMDEVKRNQLVMHILNQNLLTYYYQPIINVEDGSVYAYEALMRYEAEKISPPQIIQSAIYLKRLDDIEKATLLNVTKDVEENIDLFGDAKVFINSLPDVELSEMDDSAFTARLIKHKGRFVIEFIEESELDDERLERIKAKYKKLSSQIAIDDYGAGYSNVNNLLRYMPQYVKIDRMLISEIQDSPQKQHFVKSIIDFAHSNDIIALAEGVETREELEKCIMLGVDLIQGYYTARPQRKPVREIPFEIRSEISSYKIKYSAWNPPTVGYDER